jgi:hypothetical protein
VGGNSGGAWLIVSLTTEAYAERCWGGYQILRTPLEKQKLSDRYEVWSTANETQEEYLRNILKVYKLLASYVEEREGNAFRDLHSDKLKHIMLEDLHQLEKRLEQVADRFEELAKTVRQMGR